MIVNGFCFIVDRLADHFGGKLHMGFVTIREKMVALEVIMYMYVHVHDFIHVLFCAIGIVNVLLYMYTVTFLLWTPLGPK